MTTRTEIIIYGDFVAPAGTVVANIVINVVDSTNTVVFTDTVAPGTPEVVFTVNTGSFVLTAQAVDASGNNIGPAATDSFTVSTPVTTVTVSIPVSVSGS